MQAGGVIAGADDITHTHVTCFRCEHKGHYADKCANGVTAGADDVTHTHVTCFRCEHKGHYADKCPDGPNATLLQTEAAAAVTLLQASHTETIIAADNMNPVSDFTFTQLPSRHELIPSSWVLLDSQSTVSVFN
jgi:hypothetical protein